MSTENIGKSESVTGVFTLKVMSKVNRWLRSGYTIISKGETSEGYYVIEFCKPEKENKRFRSLVFADKKVCDQVWEYAYQKKKES